MKPWIVILFTLLAAIAGFASPQQADLFFLEGNQAFQRGDYQKAIASYEKILTLGYESGAVFYNLGNCYYKVNNTGKAILNYERARKLIPGDMDLKANIELARLNVIDKIVPQPKFVLFRIVDNWVYLIPFKPLVWTMTGFYLLAVLFLILKLLSRHALLAQIMMRLMVASVAMALLFMLSFFKQRQDVRKRVYAIVLEDKVEVMSAPGSQDGTEVFSLHEGTKLRIEKTSDAWVEILLEDGKVGWMPGGTVEKI